MRVINGWCNSKRGEEISPTEVMAATAAMLGQEGEGHTALFAAEGAALAAGGGACPACYEETVEGARYGVVFAGRLANGRELQKRFFPREEPHSRGANSRGANSCGMNSCGGENGGAYFGGTSTCGGENGGAHFGGTSTPAGAVGASGAVGEASTPADTRGRMDAAAVLHAYLEEGENALRRLEGGFAFALYDGRKRRVFLARDRLGIQPFFYTVMGDSLFFASQVKGLFAHPAIPREIDRRGLFQLLYLVPVTLMGESVFRGLRELPPACFLTFGEEGLQERCYWRPEAAPYGGTEEEAADTVLSLLSQNVARAMEDGNPAVLLSGGLDSSAVAVLARKGRETPLSTYSFEYENSRRYFTPTAFQPAGDEDFAAPLAKLLGTRHRVLTVPTERLAALLGAAAVARDLPGQADIDSSLLYFCGEIKKEHRVVLTGECSDEIFGGYPWFYRPEMQKGDTFPWVHDAQRRADLFLPSLVNRKEGLAFTAAAMKEALAGVPLLEGESEEERTARRGTWLSVRYFMRNLLERNDRMSAAAGVEMRAPFADHRLLAFVFNVPWRIKYRNGVEKSLLRRAMEKEGSLPQNVLWRKKSPYPKTRNPAYEQAVAALLAERLRHDGFLRNTLSPAAFSAFAEGEDTTWFGQLMGKPQLMAWLYQLDVWFAHFNLKLV